MHTMFKFLVQALCMYLAVTPTYAALSFLGLISRQKKNIDVYIADVDGALVHFDAGAGASSSTPQTFTMDEPGSIVDLSIKTGPTVIFKLQVGRNQALLPGVYRVDMHLSTNPMRPALNIPFNRGDVLTMVERA